MTQKGQVTKLRPVKKLGVRQFNSELGLRQQLTRKAALIEWLEVPMPETEEEKRERLMIQEAAMERNVKQELRQVFAHLIPPNKEHSKKVRSFPAYYPSRNHSLDSKKMIAFLKLM